MSTRVYLKTPNAPGQRAFLRCAASFFLEIRQYSCEKMSCATQKSLAAGHIMSFQIHPRYLKYIIYLPIWKNMTSPPTRARSATTSNSLWSSAWILSKTAGFRTSTMWKSKELVKRLTPFVAPGDAALMERHLYIDSRVKAINEGVYISVDLCHAAPSQHSRIRSSGYCLDSSSRNMFIQVELQYGITRKQELPVTGSTAPYAYRYSRM